MDQSFRVLVADKAHIIFADDICREMEESAKARGTGIAKRSPDYLVKKIEEGKAVIAVTSDNKWAGFCYIESWQDELYVANSGLIVSPEYRKYGLARQIKAKIFELSRTKYPDSKIFGLTTGLAVMKINSELGYEPVTYSELTQDDAFWQGCKSCVNYNILVSKGRKNCLCTAMLYDPKDHYEPAETITAFKKKEHVYERLLRFKQSKLMKNLKKHHVIALITAFFAGLTFIHHNQS